jgi:hypothetical protein
LPCCRRRVLKPTPSSVAAAPPGRRRSLNAPATSQVGLRPGRESARTSALQGRGRRDRRVVDTPAARTWITTPRDGVTLASGSGWRRAAAAAGAGTACGP